MNLRSGVVFTALVAVRATKLCYRCLSAVTDVVSSQVKSRQDRTGRSSPRSPPCILPVQESILRHGTWDGSGQGNPQPCPQ
jgi:hypothetical protein